MARVPFSDALRFWLKLGFNSFGGPAGQISIMHEELVEKRHWISERRFMHALNYCMMLPGPEAQQLATYIGWLMHRTAGGIAAGALFVLPALCLLIGLSWIYMAFTHVPLVAGFFYGIKPAVTAIVVQATIRIGRRTLANPLMYGLAGIAFVALLSGIPFPAVILGAALVGLAGSKWVPAFFRTAGHAPAGASHDGPLIDDATIMPEHARFGWTKLLRVVLVGLLGWAAPMVTLVLVLGWEHTVTRMAWFFTKAALLTFGGAYAVLPYVYQGAVGEFGWLSASQMIDGLALGETTPGPLIMVVTFVGFVGGFQEAFFGLGSELAAGILAAVVVTWFTFLPSFVFILAGGPLVESTHGDMKFTAPLAAISAAVVGVIANLAVFFAWHVFWPQGALSRFDGFAFALAAVAAFALLRLRRSVIEVIAASGIIGCAMQFVK